MQSLWHGLLDLTCCPEFGVGRPMWRLIITTSLMHNSLIHSACALDPFKWEFECMELVGH